MVVDLRRMRAFRAWIQTGSVSRAATELGVSQPAVSRLLHELSDGLGIPLFRRQGRRLLPTRESMLLFGEVEQILKKVAHISEISKGLKSLEARQLHIVATPAPALGILPLAIRSFVRDHPDVVVAADMAMPRDLNDWNAIGHFDVAIALMPMAHSDSIIESLVNVETVLAVPPEHPLARLDHVTPDDLKRFTLILPPRYTLLCAQWQAALRGDKSTNVVDLHTSSSLSAAQWAAAGLGVAVVDVLSTVTLDLGLTYRPIRPAMSTEYVIMFPKGEARSKLVEAFVGHLRAIANHPFPELGKITWRESPTR
jgi:DNA-binding transcriptional LysR family regulator